jgi:hypothetical protein
MATPRVGQGPHQAGEEKYDASAVSMIAMLRYGLGFPFNRLDRLQQDLEIPLPASTQWERVAAGRRQFVEVNDRFPAECRYVLEALEEVYRNDATAGKEKLSAEERLLFHQTRSGPVMEELRAWLKRQFDERLVEPNSGLGAAINYLRKHWEKLTLFLRVAGAPLDNNLCERALKKAIMHLRAERCESGRLPHRVAASRRCGGPRPGRLAPLGLPRPTCADGGLIKRGVEFGPRQKRAEHGARRMLPSRASSPTTAYSPNLSDTSWPLPLRMPAVIDRSNEADGPGRLAGAIC